MGKSYKRLSYNSIVIDKPAVEVIKAKKGLNPLYSIGGFLVINRLNFLRINFNSFYSNDKPKVLYAFYPEFIFLGINL